MISDELREFADAEVLSAIQISDLKHMADRIDAEMVELPRDRDGVPIHAGDTVYMSNGRKVHVSRVNIARDHTSIDSGPCGNGPLFFAIEPTRFTHTRPDSLEHIARDLEDWAEGSISGSAQSFANRIRELAKEDER